MKKTLLFCAAALFSLMASAGDGLTAVGANVILLPSSYWDSDIEWKAWTWVYNSGTAYGSYGTDNGNYNQICGAGGPEEDEAGLQWFEPGFDMGPKEGDKNFDRFDEEGNELQILWEEHTAPFSSDATFNGKTSYRWTTGDIMADIYVRRTFTTDQLLSGPVYLACGHDDAPAEYYINGELVYERTGYETDDNGNILNGWNNAEYILLTDEQKAFIKLNGEENVVAFHVHQNWGGAFADCGLYTKMEGGLDMGYTTPWEGKVLFNSYGGYNWDLKSPSNNPRHPWSALYEAQEGDEYTFLLENAFPADTYVTIDEETGETAKATNILEFKSPIKIEEDHNYNFKVRLLADKPITDLEILLCDNDDDDIELASDVVTVEAPEEGEEDYEGTLVEFDFGGWEVNNFKIRFDFCGVEDSTTVTIKDISLLDTSDPEDDTELWVGTHYFNFFDICKIVVKYMIWDDELNDGEGGWREAQTEEEKEVADMQTTIESVNAPEITGRVETLAWTQADFDDSMWDDQMMPVGNSGYMAEVQSIWPGGDNTNYWIRRNFELDKINERLSYDLNVCHDDVYETYVNGHLLQKNVGWTNGKNPVQVHIPAKYLNVGKNVIATYIQQNWGGKFYDCGINVTEVNYEEAVQLFNDVLAYAQTDTLLTNKMKEEVEELIAEAQQYYNENKNDGAELRNYARSLRTAVNSIFAYSPQVKTLKDTYDICRQMEDQGYWGTALDDAAIALDTCAVPSQWTDCLSKLRYARKATAFERHTENFIGCTPEIVSMDMIADDMLYGDAPKYFIYNVGAKNFLGGGESWGAHQVVEFASNPMMLLQASRDVVDEEGEPTGDIEDIEGVFYVETYRANGSIGAMDFMNWNGYMDCPLNDQGLWQLIPVEGKENVFNIARYGSNFPVEEIVDEETGETITTGGERMLLGLRNGDNAFEPSYFIVDTDNKTPELETNQWMFISREELLGLIKTADEDNPVDLTYLITNPGYDQRLSIDDWIFSNGQVWGRNGNHPNFVLESYNSQEFFNYQELWPTEEAEALPAGTYMLTVQGYYRDGIEDAHIVKYLSGTPIDQRALIFAGPDTPDEEGLSASCTSVPLMGIHIESGKYPGIGYKLGGMEMPGTYSGQPYSACDQAANDYFGVGLYLNKLAFHITEDDPGHLTLGVWKEYDENTPGGDWIVMDNWRLKYYGGAMLDPDGIGGIASDEINNSTTASKGIYNMLGQRLSKTQKGVNIVNGKKIIKK